MRSSLFIIILVISSLNVRAEVDIDLNFDPQDFRDQIIDDIIANAVYQNDSFYGWPHRTIVDGVDDVMNWMRGYNVGIAGIADTMLDFIADNRVLALVNESINHFYSTRNIENQGVSWGRFVGFDSEKWFGQRYGSTGIMKFLAHASNMIENSYIAELIDEGLSFLLESQLADGSWDMSLDNYQTSGMEYGMAGMGSDFLDIYRSTNILQFLELSLDVADWIISKGIWNRDRFTIPWTTDDKADSTLDGLVFTGFGTGESGGMSFLLEMYKETGNATFLGYAEAISLDLMNRESDGAWKNGISPFISNIYGAEDKQTGLRSGSPGIALAFFDLYDISDNDALLETNARVELFMRNQVSDEGTVPFADGHQNIRYTGRAMGSLGVVEYYIELYNRYGGRNYLDMIKLIMNHIHQLYNDNGYLMVDEAFPEWGRSYNIEDGLAGLIMVLNSIIDIDYTGSLDNYIDVLSVQSKESYSFFISLGVVIAVFVVYLKRKGYF